MSSPFLCSKPFLHDFIPVLPSTTGLHPTIRLKPSLFPRCFFFLAPFPSLSAALSTSKPHAAKLLDKISKTECSDENTFSVSPAPEKELLFTGFSSSRQGKEEENGNLKKSVDSSKEMKPEKKGREGKLNSEEVEFRIRLDMCSKTYEKMSLEEFSTSEAVMTSSTGDGDMTSEIVTFSSCGSEVEKHMMELGITPEEHELEALLRASVEAGRGEKAYYLLHKLRTIVRKVSPSTADAIDAWFRSSTAVRVGKRKWDIQAIKQAMENGGGGWHGLGWLGKGKWNVVRTRVDGEGACLCCGEKLVSVDLDPVETESFAECVESIVIKKERNSNFEKFQLARNPPSKPATSSLEASSRTLPPIIGTLPAPPPSASLRLPPIPRVNAVANGIRQKLPSKKWPLIIIHNKRLFGGKMNEPCNRKLIEKWKNADAIYETPTGSNDDWYWLYAAIKCKCLVVTNDEMRDHVFHALGNDFFAKWKERHQVHFNHIDGSFQFIMPRPFSVVIQESERGHWHIPIAESEQGSNRSWMCVTRASSRVISASSSNLFTDVPGDSATEITDLDAEASGQLSSSSSSKDPEKRTKNSFQIFTSAIKSPKSQIVSVIEDAEKIGGCIIDFEI